MPPGTLDFYGASAQIIPVLVLVLIVEQRDDKRRFPPLPNLIYVLLTFGVAGIGEIVSLRALYRSHAYPQDQYIVVASILLCSLAPTAPIVASALREIETGEKRWQQTSARLAAP